MPGLRRRKPSLVKRRPLERWPGEPGGTCDASGPCSPSGAYLRLELGPGGERVGDCFEESFTLGGSLQDDRILLSGLLQIFGCKDDRKHGGVALHPLTDGLSVGHANQNQIPPSAAQHSF